MRLPLGWGFVVLAVWIGPSAALAGGPTLSGPYVSTSFGISAPIDPDIEVPGADGSLGTEFGFQGSVAMGAGFATNWRAEVELSLIENDISKVRINGVGSIPLDGEIGVLTGMAKVAYDFEIGSMRPYLAAGVGFANYEVSVTGQSDSDTVLAGEIEGGVTIPLTDQLDLFTSSKLVMLTSFHLDPANNGGADIENPILMSSSMGLRIRF